MKDIIVHQVNISHYRLVELSNLADQAKPFYDWVEKIAKQVSGKNKSLNDILFSSTKSQIHQIISRCFEYGELIEKPFLFDGIGRVYKHPKACFYFFAWLIRDAPQQRLIPLISRMQKIESLEKLVAEIDTLSELIFEYKTVVKTFEWQTVREIIIDRLEGSRRSISGHRIESYVRTSFVAAIQHYFSIHNDYGRFKKIEFADKQIKIGRHTVDISAQLIGKKVDFVENLLIPVKTRETEGGGHSHLFTRDIISAITDIKKEVNNNYLVVVIVAENWSPAELQTIDDAIDVIFHFNINPNKFFCFDEESQIKLNQFIETLFSSK